MSDRPAKKKSLGAGRFLRFSAIYAIGDVLTKGAQIILLPYYVSVLTKSEVGTLAVLTTLVVVTWNLMALALGFAIRRYYYEQEGNGDQYVSTLWVSRLFGGLPLFGLLIGFAYLVHGWSGTEIAWLYILVALCSGYLKGGLNVVESWLVIREEPVKYRTFTFLQFITTTVLIIYLISFREMGVFGAVIGELISYAFWTCISAVMVLRKSLPKLSSVNWSECFWYCLPALPHVFFMWGLNAADRLILEQHVPLAEIGVYDTGYKLASFLSVVVMAMRAAWLPNYFKTANEEGATERYSKMATVFFYFLFYGALGGILFAPEGVALISVKAIGDYSQAATILRIVVLGIVGMGLFIAFNQPLFYERKTGVVAMVSGIGLITNVVTNLLLIPRFGILGSAIATVVSYAVMAAVMLGLVNKMYKFAWETRQALFLAAVAGACAILGCFVPNEVAPWTFAIKVCLAIAFPLITLFKLQKSEHSGLSIGPRFSWFDRGMKGNKLT